MDKQRFIRIKGKLVSVTEDVYQTYYRMFEHEQYLLRKDRLKGKVLYSDMDTDEILGEESIPDIDAPSVDELACINIMVDKLRIAMTSLPQEEQKLITDLYFKRKTQTQLQAETGILAITYGS